MLSYTIINSHAQVRDPGPEDRLVISLIFLDPLVKFFFVSHANVYRNAL